jgi:hypothetical protein
VGRVKMNMRLALDAPRTRSARCASEDIVACIKALVELRDGAATSTTSTTSATAACARSAS